LDLKNKFKINFNQLLKSFFSRCPDTFMMFSFNDYHF
jgi:hypothetical protein